MLRDFRLEPTARRVRVVLGGVVVADSPAAWLGVGGYAPPAYELGTWWFDRAEVREDLLVPGSPGPTCLVRGRAERLTLRIGERRWPDVALRYPEPPTPGWEPLAGLVTFAWDDVEHWYEEDEEVWVHPRGPYHRVDVCASSREVEVAAAGVVLARSSRPLALFETGMPTRWYLPRADVALEHLSPSATRTQCPYKGVAAYYAAAVGGREVADLAWTYPEPVTECRRIAQHVCFFAERVDLRLDGVLQDRPVTKWEHAIPARDVLLGSDRGA